MAEYPTERLKCWNKAKELRRKIYGEFVTAREKGELVCAGSGASHFALPQGLGKVHWLSGESYGALIAANKDLCTEALETFEKAGYARDLCAYMRDFLGAQMIDKYADAEGKIYPFPIMDFYFTYHVCDDHARWWMISSEIQKEKKGYEAPLFAYEQPGCYHWAEMTTPWAQDYVLEQMLEGIEWMEKVTGRKWDDERFKEAFRNEARTGKAYTEAMMCNQNIPAPLDEKMIYVFLGLTSIRPWDPEVASFMEEFRDEIRDRADRGIAAIPNERYRIMTDSNPPWQGLQIFRHIEKEYGVVSLGSIYSLGLHGPWMYDENKNVVPSPIPHDSGVPMNTREEILRAHIEWKGSFMTGFEVFNSIAHGELVKRMFEQWKVNGMMMHLNRGCVGNVGQKLIRLDLLEAGYPVCVYEGNVGDYREFDLDRSLEKIDSFFDGVIGKVRKE